MSKEAIKEVAEKAAKKEIIIDKKIEAMAAIIDPLVTIEEDGTVIEAEGIYFECLLDGVTKELRETIRENDEIFAAATGLVVGRKSNKAYVANKELNEVSVTFPMCGRDKLTIQSKRHVSTVNPKDRAQTHDNYGVIRAVVHTSFGDKDTGHFGSVAKFVKEAAADALRDL